jgi:LEA14-like dessication related protein
MSKLSKGHLRKGTQTGLSAFFCIRGKLFAQAPSAPIITLLLAVASSAQTGTLVEKKPAFQLEGVSIERVDWDARSAETKLSIAIDNPGSAFTLKDLSYRLKLNDSQAAEGKYPKEIAVPGHSSVAFNLPCSVDLAAMPGIAWRIIAGGFDVHYELETEFTVPIFLWISPRIKSSIAGDLSLLGTVSGWTARIKEHISVK